MNKQINHELFSSYLYLSMAAHFDKEGLPGFAAWMKAQSAASGGVNPTFTVHALAARTTSYLLENWSSLIR